MRMRFSEMMGSGSELAAKPGTWSETDAGTAEAAVAAALSPYLASAVTVATDTVADDHVATGLPGSTSETREPVVADAASPAPTPAPTSPGLDVAIPLDPAPVRRSWPVERPRPADPDLGATPASAAPEPIADFTPLSDDLLPHRR
jgi:hypothetical protein